MKKQRLGLFGRGLCSEAESGREKRNESEGRAKRGKIFPADEADLLPNPMEIKRQEGCQGCVMGLCLRGRYVLAGLGECLWNGNHKPRAGEYVTECHTTFAVRVRMLDSM